MDLATIIGLIAGVNAAQVKAILETTIEHTRERHYQGIGFFALAGGEPFPGVVKAQNSYYQFFSDRTSVIL
jgi:flagellar motor component MotA